MLRASARLFTFMLPSAAAVTAIVTFAEKQINILIYGAIVAGAIAGGLLGGAVLTIASRPLWKRLLRVSNRNNANWLEGRPIELALLGWKLTSLQPREPLRLPAFGQPPHGPEATANPSAG